jgi:hypothetical protein
VTAFALLLVGAAGLGLAILTGFVGRPSWMTPPRLALGIGVCFVLAVVGGYLQLSSPDDHLRSVDGSAEPVTPAAVGSKVLAYVDQSAGFPILFSVRADGTSRQRLAQIENSALPAFSSPDEMVVSYIPRGEENRSVLQVRKLDGSLVKNLTDPAEPFLDTSPSVATAIDEVFFVRSEYRQIDASNATWENPRIMRVPIDGDESQVTAVRTDAPLLDHLGTDARGRTLAATCALPDGPGAAALCLVDVTSGAVRYLTDGTATAGEPVMSPDGNAVAFSSPESNPFGTIEVWVGRAPDFKPKLLTKVTGRGDHPAWSSDSRCLIFTHAERLDDEGDLMLLCDGMDQPVLVVSSAYAGAWLPD